MDEYRDEVLKRDFNFEGVTLMEGANDTVSSDKTVEL